MGVYGPMRKLFMCAEVKVVSGGAIISRCLRSQGQS
jgi:hypothetical protein